MAYWREYKSKKTGAVNNRVLVYTAKDRALQASRRESRYGLPTWRTIGGLQNRRENWRIRFVPDDQDLRSNYRDTCETLAAYRARYHANLRVKHNRAAPCWSIQVGVKVVWNHALDIGLDQAAIDHTLETIRYLERVARAYRISL